MTTSTSNELAEADLRQILATAPDGDYLVAYDNIVDRVDREGRNTQIVNRSARVERFKAAVAAGDRETLKKAFETFRSYIKKVRKNAKLSANDEPRQLTVAEASGLMTEALALKEVETVTKARWEELKRLTFGHMTEQFAEEGEDHPEHINGSIDVPELGYRFAREGAGRKEPALQEGVLQSLLDPEVWERVVDRKTIVEERVNVGKLMAEAQRDPAILEYLRRSLKVGEWKSPRLNVREL